MDKNNRTWLEIYNVSQFADYLRKVVYLNFRDSTEDDDTDISKCFNQLTDEEKKELNNCLTLNESEVIVKENSRRMKHKKTKQTVYLMNNNILNKLLENLNQRLVSNIISSLVSKGLLESAYDEKEDDFVFWIADKYREDGDDT